MGVLFIFADIWGIEEEGILLRQTFKLAILDLNTQNRAFAFSGDFLEVVKTMLGMPLGSLESQLLVLKSLKTARPSK